MCCLKTDKQYDTTRESLSHNFSNTEAVLNFRSWKKLANAHHFYEQTQLNYEMYALQF